MCDSVVVVPESGPVWFAKNSDREPSEAQFLECHEPGGLLEPSPSDLPAAEAPERVLISRPSWMWGCEMGVNASGVAIGNEAVFTRLPIGKTGYSGMDFIRIALANARSADDALEQLIELCKRYPQGGRMGHRNRSFRYHSAFLIADPRTAWVFETAGEFWAAKRVRGVAAISNELTLEDDFDRIDERAYSYARRRGWIDPKRGFAFATAFSHRPLSRLAGAAERRRCTTQAVRGLHGNGRTPSAEDFIRALTNHAGFAPGEARRSVSPCAHASWLPTMTASQTTASMVARLDHEGPAVWATGTSSPCLSVYKPAPLDPALFAPRAVVDARFDADELWWRHEQLHRTCLVDYGPRRQSIAADLARMQAACLHQTPAADAAGLWEAHHAAVDDWRRRAASAGRERRDRLRRRYWRKQASAVGLPVEA